MDKDLKDTFGNLSDALDSDFESADIDTKLQVIEKSKNEIDEKVKSEDVTLEDKEYMSETLKLLIDSGKNVLKTLEKDIKIGSPAGQARIFFEGMSRVSDTIKNLLELNKSVASIKVKEGGKNNSIKNLTVNQFYSSKDLLQMVNNAKDNNEMKEIKAEFKIEDDAL